ncbi:MAG: hypothetical protein RL557_560 [archaeon]|jgi:hypothetical protein
MRKTRNLGTLACVALGLATVGNMFWQTIDYASVKLFLHEQVKREYSSEMRGAKELRIKKGTLIDAVPSSYDKHSLIKERLFVNGKVQWESDLTKNGYDFPRAILHSPAKNTEIPDLPAGENIICYETVDAHGNINRAAAKVYVEE